VRISEIILEKRKNPENNPKISSHAQLEKYKDDDNIFVSFTQIPKLGINPKSIYKTPIGIYAYPLKASWDYYGLDESLSQLPFASEQPYIQVFSYNGTGKFLTDLKKYNEKDLSNDTNILLELFRDKSSREFIERSKKKIYDYPFEIFWNLTKELASFNAVKWNKLFRKVGYAGFSDSTASRIIHPSEPIQSVFFSKSAINYITEIDNKSYEIKPSSAKKTSKYKSDTLDPNELKDALTHAMHNRYRNKKIEPYILQNADSSDLAKYVKVCYKGRWPEAEKQLLDKKDSIGLALYADAIQKRWPEAEQYIMKDPHAAYLYAIYALKSRWLAAEKIIKTDESEWMHYQNQLSHMDYNYINDDDLKDIKLSSINIKYRIAHEIDNLNELKTDYKSRLESYKELDRLLKNPKTEQEIDTVNKNKQILIKLKSDLFDVLKSKRDEILEKDRLVKDLKEKQKSFQTKLQRKERNLDYAKSVRD
jgi:hypothetical protein